MSNNLSHSLSRRCCCGRYITLVEENLGMNVLWYKCPDCKQREMDKLYGRELTPEEYYKQLGIGDKNRIW